MEILSGRTGTPHVTSEQFRQIFEGLIGGGSYIFTNGENMEPELESNNLLKIKSGMMCHHGCISLVKLRTYDEVNLENGNQGKNRIDLVVNRYTKNGSTENEDCDWVVIKGTEDAGTPVVPAHTVGNMQNGDFIDDCPVFEVHYEGLAVTEIKKLLPVMKGVVNVHDLIVKNEQTINMLELPIQNGTLVYTGQAQTPVWNHYDANKMTAEGALTGTNIGAYTVMFTPKTNYQWADGTTVAKKSQWYIHPAMDAAMSDTSDNMVSNKTIKKYIDEYMGDIANLLGGI